MNGRGPGTLAAPIPKARGPGAAGIGLWWLGQAGFLIEAPSARILVDPYLSDSLAIKYKGTKRPHVRMVPPAVDPASLRDIDLVLVSHGHGDHLDGSTLGPVAAGNPGATFVVPGSTVEKALGRGVPAGRLIAAEAFARLESGRVLVHVLPSAHEELAIDGHGRHLALGYVIEVDGVAIYHPGDCAPYAGLLDNLAPHRIDLALLPVNGRDGERRADGVLGNFSLEEALALAESAGFGAAIGHHFGMFDFNTIDLDAARAFLGARRNGTPFLLAEEGLRYTVDAPAGKRPGEGEGRRR